MKFKDRAEQRRVQETISDILLNVKKIANEYVKECIDIALRIIEDTEIEGK